MKLSVAESSEIFRENLFWLIVAQAAAMLPLFFHLPFWVFAFWLVALSWRLLIYQRHLSFPKMPIKVVMALGSIVAIFFQYSGKIGSEPMIAFLACSFTMKMIEMRTRKDALIVIFIAFIAIATQFLFAQDLTAGLYGLASLFVLISAWAAIFRQRKLSLLQHFRIGGTLVLHATPMMLLLFIVMPRLGPLWHVPLPSNQGRTGFSDSIELGDVGQLVQSPEVAFRAQFEKASLNNRDLYWRSLVLGHFDGRRWSVWGESEERPISRIRDGGQEVQDSLAYSVVMEPHNYRWLFSIGEPIAAESAQVDLSTNSQGLLVAKDPINKKIEYRVKASLSISNPHLTRTERARNLQLPANSNPQSQTLAQSWVSSGLSGRELVDSALQLYQEEFHYTLRAPVVRGDVIDEFIFQSKAGFCEHFASSFVFLMRSAGVPARVLIGYQGGQPAINSGYWIVRQSDAHAWAEVWLENEGWVRVDPTAFVAPSRIDLGVEGALDEQDLQLLEPTWQVKLFRQVVRRWDSLSYSWNRWVLNYDNDKQSGLMRKLLGSTDPWRLGGLLVGIFVALVMPIMFFNWWRNRPRYRFNENKLYQPIVNRLRRQGVKKEPRESMGTFLRRAALRMPADEAGRYQKLADIYERHVYSGRSNLSDAQIKKLVSALARRRIKSNMPIEMS